jgi:phosphoenolpyruvate carboxykinase (ATP)
LLIFKKKKNRRSPKDKRTVLDDVTKDTIWWGPVNIPVNPDTHNFCKDMAIKYLNTR